jgi:uncharacterized protein (DUF433 family)
MNWKDYIVADAEVLGGKPTVKGTRISVEFIIERLAHGWTETQLLENYPRLTRQHLQAVFAYVQECIEDGSLVSPSPKIAPSA